MPNRLPDYSLVFSIVAAAQLAVNHAEQFVILLVVEHGTFSHPSIINFSLTFDDRIEFSEEEPLGIYLPCDLVNIVADTFQLNKHL